MEHSEIIAGFVGAIGGAVASSWASAYLTGRQAKTAFSFEMHKELNSEGMMVHRTKSQ